jgi:hypothetical protein
LMWWIALRWRRRATQETPSSCTAGAGLYNPLRLAFCESAGMTAKLSLYSTDCMVLRAMRSESSRDYACWTQASNGRQTNMRIKARTEQQKPRPLGTQSSVAPVSGVRLDCWKSRSATKMPAADGLMSMFPVFARECYGGRPQTKRVIRISAHRGTKLPN